MSPRALTEQEKSLQKQKIMDRAQELVNAHGVKKVSVDDIVRAAGVGKAAFYKFFTSKEALIMELVWRVYAGIVDQASRMILDCPKDALREQVGVFLGAFLRDREKLFFLNNHQELEELIAALDTAEIRSFNQLECRALEQVIRLAGLDVERVKPAVVHNYIHAMYFAVSDISLIPAHLDETLAVMIEGLLVYLFGPAGP